MAVIYCDQCKAERDLLPIYRAVAVVGVSRSTIYYWIDKKWVHWKELASGRRVICLHSLVHSSSTSSG
jgi:hypothetical protein